MFKSCSNTKMIKSDEFMLTVVSDECDSDTFMIQYFESDSMLHEGNVEVNHAIGFALDIDKFSASGCKSVNVSFNYCSNVNAKLAAISLSAAIVEAFAEKCINVVSIDIKDN